MRLQASKSAPDSASLSQLGLSMPLPPISVPLSPSLSPYKITPVNGGTSSKVKCKTAIIPQLSKAELDSKVKVSSNFQGLKMASSILKSKLPDSPPGKPKSSQQTQHRSDFSTRYFKKRLIVKYKKVQIILLNYPDILVKTSDANH